MTQHDNRQSTMPPLLARYIDRCETPADVTLPTFLCLVLLSGRVKKRFFGGEYVTIADPFDVFGQVCEAGALIATRSNGNLNLLGQLASLNTIDIDSSDWFVNRLGLESDLALYGKNFVNPPPSLRYFQNAIGWINLDVGWPADRRRIEAALERKMGLDDRKIGMMLSSASVSFNKGIIFALTYPDRCAEMDYIQDALRDRNDIPYDMSQQPSVAERNELQLAIVREWARLCRPDLAYLLEESSTLARGSARGTSDVQASFTREEYERMGLPASLAVRFNELISSQFVNNPSLPWFLWLAYMSEHITPDSSGRDLVNMGKILAALGVICEIGGVVGRTTDIESVRLLSLTVDPLTTRQVIEDSGSTSVDEFWKEVTEVAVEELDIYSVDYGYNPPGLLPLVVYGRYRDQYIGYPNNIESIKRIHDTQIDLWVHLRHRLKEEIACVDLLFATGIALVRNHPETFAGKHGVYVDEAPDPITKTYKNPQSETNLRVGSTYSREEQLHLCRVWADLYRPEAKALFEEAS